MDDESVLQFLFIGAFVGILLLPLFVRSRRRGGGTGDDGGWNGDGDGDGRGGDGD